MTIGQVHLPVFSAIAPKLLLSTAKRIISISYPLGKQLAKFSFYLMAQSC